MKSANFPPQPKQPCFEFLKRIGSREWALLLKSKSMFESLQRPTETWKACAKRARFAGTCSIGSMPSPFECLRLDNAGKRSRSSRATFSNKPQKRMTYRFGISPIKR